MLESTVRNILFFDTILKPHHEKIEHIPLDGILRSVEIENGIEPFVKLIDNDQAAVRLNQVEIDQDKQIATLLISYADKRGADPVFADLQKGTLRAETKLEGEGVAISAHLIFSLKREFPSGLYAALLEDVPGVGRTLLDPFLRSVFKNASSYTFENENKKQQKTWPVPTLIIKQSEQLIKSLKSGGYLTEVEVTKYNSASGFDTIENLEEKKTTTTIKIEGRPTGEKAKDILNKLKIVANSKGYFDMRVKWINSNKERKTVSLGTARADAGDALYGRVERVTLDTAVPQCTSIINREIQAKMMSLLK